MQSVRVAGTALAVACALAAWGQNPEHRFYPSYQLERPVDRVLAKAHPSAGDWVGERDFAAVDAQLKRIARSLLADRNSFKPLATETERFSELALVEFKILSTSRNENQPPLVRSAVRIELGGTADDGGLLSRLATAQLTWAADEDGLALRDFAVGDIRGGRSSAFGFAEVTDQVFGGIESFREQLVAGVDHWRDSIDAAAGVTVYGHQGLSLGDFDGDGLDDLYVSQPAGLPNRLYRNNGDGTFSDATRRAGLDILDDTSMSLFGDVDSDGDQDLILVGPTPLLFRNAGDGSFSLDGSAGFDLPEEKAAMFTGAALADYDLDGDLDLYVCAYDFWQPGAQYDAPTPYYDAVNGPPNLLFQNDGQGRFEEVAALAGLQPTNNRFSFAAAWADYDSDGDPDLYVANDFGRNNLYRNNGDGTFVEAAGELGVEDLGAGMSAAWGDYDNDGDLDLYTANMWSSAGLRITTSPQFDAVAPSAAVRGDFKRHAQGNSLFRNDGALGFRDVSDEAGVRTGRWAWASDFVDLDGDGLLDLFVQNGYITGESLDDL